MCIVLFLSTGCDTNYPLMTDAEITQQEKRELREWKKTKEGVRYFTTCAEGKLFVATESTHNYIQLAGTLGDCPNDKGNR